MYAKRLMRNRVLFFRYAPPMTRLDVNQERRPNPPHRDAELHQRSAYYFWWAFLRENTAYIDCCDNGGAGPLAQLYADFGDVRGADCRDTFMRWWKGARDLFCEPPEQKIEFFDEPPSEHDSRNRILLSLPITGDMDQTFAELRQLLQPIYFKARMRIREAARGSGASVKDGADDISLARYPVASKPVLASLYGYLRVWQAKKAHPNAQAMEIAEISGILQSIAGKNDDPEFRERVRQRVRDYEKKAATLIANVGLGRFPDFTANADARDAKGNAF
jgi:hypothetical protein